MKGKEKAGGADQGAGKTKTRRENPEDEDKAAKRGRTDKEDIEEETEEADTQSATLDPGGAASLQRDETTILRG